MNFFSFDNSLYIDNHCIKILSTRLSAMPAILSHEYRMFLIRGEIKKMRKYRGNHKPYSLAIICYFNVSTLDLHNLRISGVLERVDIFNKK